MTPHTIRVAEATPFIKGTRAIHEGVWNSIRDAALAGEGTFTPGIGETNNLFQGDKAEGIH
jgi:hypothetical protein